MAINIEEINALLRMSIYRSKEDIITDAIRELERYLSQSRNLKWRLLLTGIKTKKLASGERQI
jgi:hypothetical protein